MDNDDEFEFHKLAWVCGKAVSLIVTQSTASGMEQFLRGCLRPGWPQSLFDVASQSAGFLGLHEVVSGWMSHGWWAKSLFVYRGMELGWKHNEDLTLWLTFSWWPDWPTKLAWLTGSEFNISTRCRTFLAKPEQTLPKQSSPSNLASNSIDQLSPPPWKFLKLKFALEWCQHSHSSATKLPHHVMLCINCRNMPFHDHSRASYQTSNLSRLQHSFRLIISDLFYVFIDVQ